MQVSGRLIIFLTLSVALAMSGAGWWYQYQVSRQAAQFWGGPAARLLVAGSTVEFLELGPLDGETPPTEQLAERAIVATHDISKSPGLIHLRHVFAQDSNFVWHERRTEPVTAADWAYALRFAEADQSLVILLRRDLKEIGKLDAEGGRAEVLPCPRVAAPVRTYLTEVGAMAPLEAPAR